ncbi:MAG: ribosome biogenesis GTPase Der [Candidatus Berkelbacteria bacterium]|nr:ribosome biogenesis GTPase Der [Candidatus Berkelbacteria bacterium]
MQSPPVVAIIGRPNVGKSTLFNRLVGKREAIVAYEAGTTRDRVMAEVEWNNKKFILFDTAGLILDFFGFDEAEIEKKAQEKINDVLSDSDIILLVLDQQSGVTAEDEEIAKKIRKLNKRVIVVFNKSDSLSHEESSSLQNTLGFKESMAVSAISGRRTGQLLDYLTNDFIEPEKPSTKSPKISIIGRPNVGKSTLFNVLAGSDVAIVSDTSGTTRDLVKVKTDILKSNDDVPIELIDTAGFRKRGKIKPGIEKFSVIRSVEAIYKSDLSLLVVDAAEGFSRPDAHLAQLALDKKTKIIIVLNKIDLLKNQTKDEIKNLNKFYFLTKLTMVAVSAKNKLNIELLISEIIRTLKD